MSRTWRKSQYRPTTEKAFANTPCRQYPQGDEYYCPCGIRWGVDEERPACLKGK